MHDLSRVPAQAVVNGIFTAASAGEPMASRQAIEAVPGLGLVGDRYAAGCGSFSRRPRADGGREITLFEAETRRWLWEATGIRMPAVASRRNIETVGVRLADLIGREFMIGDVVCVGVAMCHPCKRLEETSGLHIMKLLVGRGGIRAAIRKGGRIYLGDRVLAIDP